MNKSTKTGIKRKLKKDEIKDEDVKNAKICKEEPPEAQPTTSKSDSCLDLPQWREHELLSEQLSLDLNISQNIVKLLEDGNTIPFIARYRKHVTNNMTPETLRVVKETYEEICVLKRKISTVVKSLEKTSNLSDQVHRAVVTSRSVEELEYVYTPYKPGGKRTLAERAKQLGLEQFALDLLENNRSVDLFKLVDQGKKELSTVEDVEKGIGHIIAPVIATDTEMLSVLREMRSRSNFVLKSKKMMGKSKTENKDEGKFENYSNFEIGVKYIKPHQVLAINRGESLKVLSVKIDVPDNIFHDFQSFCLKKWMNKGKFNESRNKVLKQAIEDSYSRLVQPLIVREIRAELKQKAQRASCEVFSTNLKHLLLNPPLKGKPILGIDPGFSNGCKLALISSLGTLLDHAVIYVHRSANQATSLLKNMLEQHHCEIIALGNGKACRETEEWLSKLIQNKTFHPLNVKYTIVNEDGASIYSCSPEAKTEFPDLDPNIISAVSLARRIQDPLSELVKVEPKHLGIGMYQHDLKKKQLEEELNDVVSECVSFVGVDLNTTSQCLLQHVAGMSQKRAQQVIWHRNKSGPFTCRSEIMDVFGIGQKVFQQCVGFLRVGPLDGDKINFYKKPKTTKLDCTYIHPESYDVTKKLMKKMNLDINNLGERHFINAVQRQISSFNLPVLSEELKTDEENLRFILDALCKTLNYDLRSEILQEPLFKQDLKSLNDLKCGEILTGRISNVTHFGSFIDVGVGQNGLIHTSKYNGFSPQIGEKYEVEVVSLDFEKKRIGLAALKKIC